jgi:hypothetical protein
MAINMSYFTANAFHNESLGGPVNTVDVYAMKALLTKAS